MEHDYYFQCPVCKKMLPVEITINNKPYCTCNDCGVQLFVRGKQGIKRLSKLIGKMNLRGNAKDLINTVDYLNALKEKLNEIDMKKPIFGKDLDLDLQEKAVIAQINRLRKVLEEENRSKK